MLHRSSFFDNFGQILIKYPEIDLNDFFSKGQMESKRWLTEELVNLGLDYGTIFLCAGWYGSLATFLLEANIKIDKIRSFDIDPKCADIADTFNRSWVLDSWQFKATTLDIMEMQYPLKYTTLRANGTGVELNEMPNTIINTSCEHIKDFEKWYSAIPSGTLVILQSNNFFEIEDHVNCSEDVDEFYNLAPMETTLFIGELELPKYKRFMKIGYK